MRSAADLQPLKYTEKARDNLRRSEVISRKGNEEYRLGETPELYSLFNTMSGSFKGKFQSFVELALRGASPGRRNSLWLAP
jgi:hypothetical protein